MSCSPRECQLHNVISTSLCPRLGGRQGYVLASSEPHLHAARRGALSQPRAAQSEHVPRTSALIRALGSANLAFERRLIDLRFRAPESQSLRPKTELSLTRSCTRSVAHDKTPTPQRGMADSRRASLEENRRN